MTTENSQKIQKLQVSQSIAKLSDSISRLEVEMQALIDATTYLTGPKGDSESDVAVISHPVPIIQDLYVFDSRINIIRETIQTYKHNLVVGAPDSAGASVGGTKAKYANAG